MDERTKVLRVARYRPERAPTPYFDEYEVPYADDTVVLDALNHIKDDIDGSLSFRWSCRMGVCGSCGMMVNGEPRLTCAAFLREFPARSAIVVEPLQYFPVIAYIARPTGSNPRLPRHSPETTASTQGWTRARLHPSTRNAAPPGSRLRTAFAVGPMPVRARSAVTPRYIKRGIVDELSLADGGQGGVRPPLTGLKSDSRLPGAFYRARASALSAQIGQGHSSRRCSNV